MPTNYIPNTNVAAEVIDPADPQGYVSLYLDSGEKGINKNMGSVNAGTSNAGYVFMVGLGGINIAFERSLNKAGQDTDRYKTIHQNLYDKAASKLYAYEDNFDPKDPVRFSIIQKPDPLFGLPDYDGVVFIDIFNDTQIPNNNKFNYSMIYLVPPDRKNYQDINSFLKAVESSAITIVKALEVYNSDYALNSTFGLETIEYIRMCLFSGAIYRGDASQDDVALHNIIGLENGFKNSGNKNIISLVSFENSYDTQTDQNVFRAIKAELSTQAQ